MLSWLFACLFTQISLDCHVSSNLLDKTFRHKVICMCWLLGLVILLEALSEIELAIIVCLLAGGLKQSP